MIEIENLQFAYKKRLVFDELSISFEMGKVYGLFGKNGTGKSTLLYNICGLLFPKGGSISVLNQVPKKRTPSFLQNIFLVPEDYYLPDVYIDELIKYYAAFYPKFDRAQFVQYLQAFEVPLNYNLYKMSMGQKKKVLICFSLACNTAILLMDEPTNGLDIMSKQQFKKILAGIVEEGRCIIISTHQAKDLESLIDQITIIDEGRILFNQSIETVSEKMLFKISNDKSELTNALYAEESLGGNVLVMPNTEGGAGKVDLELLYKAVLTNAATVHKIFN